MSIYNIHFLNARNALTGVMPETRAAAREAVAAAEDHTPLPRFDLVIRTGDEVMTGWGIGGCAPAPGQIQITLDPARFAPEPFIRTLVHELHHLIRWDGPGYGKSLGEALVSKYSWLDAAIAKRWAITYGNRSWSLLEGAQGLSDLGEHIGSGLYSREVDYLCNQEWALDAQDILWRRTKLGLFTTAEEQAHLSQYMATLDLKHRKVQAA